MRRILAICREASRKPPAEEGTQKLRRTSYFSGAVAQLGGQLIGRSGRPPTMTRGGATEDMNCETSAR